MAGNSLSHVINQFSGMSPTNPTFVNPTQPPNVGGVGTGF